MLLKFESAILEPVAPYLLRALMELGQKLQRRLQTQVRPSRTGAWIRGGLNRLQSVALPATEVFHWVLQRLSAVASLVSLSAPLSPLLTVPTKMSLQSSLFLGGLLLPTVIYLLRMMTLQRTRTSRSPVAATTTAARKAAASEASRRNDAARNSRKKAKKPRRSQSGGGCHARAADNVNPSLPSQAPAGAKEGGPPPAAAPSTGRQPGQPRVKQPRMKQPLEQQPQPVQANKGGQAKQMRSKVSPEDVVTLAAEDNGAGPAERITEAEVRQQSSSIYAPKATPEAKTPTDACKLPPLAKNDETSSFAMRRKKVPTVISARVNPGKSLSTAPVMRPTRSSGATPAATVTKPTRLGDMRPTRQLSDASKTRGSSAPCPAAAATATEAVQVVAPGAGSCSTLDDNTAPLPSSTETVPSSKQIAWAQVVKADRACAPGSPVDKASADVSSPPAQKTLPVKNASPEPETSSALATASRKSQPRSRNRRSSARKKSPPATSLSCGPTSHVHHKQSTPSSHPMGASPPGYGLHWPRPPVGHGPVVRRLPRNPSVSGPLPYGQFPPIVFGVACTVGIRTR